jgi:hypothetical protein
MKFRPQRGSLADAMAEVVILPPTKDALAEHYNKTVSFGPSLKPEQIEVLPYGFDSRINWRTFSVTAPGFGVIGFTDGPVDDVR